MFVFFYIWFYSKHVFLRRFAWIACSAYMYVHLYWELCYAVTICELLSLANMGGVMSEIIPGLYVGSFNDARDESALSAAGITHILAVHDVRSNTPTTARVRQYRRMHASDNATQNLRQFFHEACEFIHEGRSAESGHGAVLVHCMAGVSRSVTLTLAYMCALLQRPWRDALRVVKCKRPVASPNYNFQYQLQSWQVWQLPTKCGRAAQSIWISSILVLIFCQAEEEDIVALDRLKQRFGVWARLEEDQDLFDKYLASFLELRYSNRPGQELNLAEGLDGQVWNWNTGLTANWRMRLVFCDFVERICVRASCLWGHSKRMAKIHLLTQQMWENRKKTNLVW